MNFNTNYPNFNPLDPVQLAGLIQFLQTHDRDFQQQGYTKDNLTAVYRYFDANGQLLYLKPRFDKDGKKFIKPCWFDGIRFFLGEPKDRYDPKAKPLYHLPQLLNSPADSPVFFVEGEKATDAMNNLGLLAVTSGASSSINNTDLTPLVGRQVIIWRDYDTAGQKWLTDLSHALDGLNIAYSVIDVDAYAQAYALNKADDAFDFIANGQRQGMNNGQIIQQIHALPKLDRQSYITTHRQPPSQHKTAKTDDKEKWGDIVPFDEVKNIETPFPVDAFPPFLQEVIAKCSFYQQVPQSIAGFGVLGAISHIGQAFIDAPYLSSDYNPASLFLVVQSESGGGKTRTMSITHKAIDDHIKAEDENYKENKRLYENSLAGKSKREITAFQNENHKPTDPRNLFGSGSIQKVMQGFTDGNYKNASYAADEGANLLEGASLKSETAGSSIGALCVMYSKGLAERITISNTNTQVAYNVRLTMLLAGQEIAIKPALNDARLTQQGLLPRCLFAFPPDNRGSRKLIKQSFLNDEVLQNYWKKCRNFLELQPPTNHRFKMAWEASALATAQDYWQQVENSQQKGKPNEHYKAYASRFVENATRIASLFAWFDERRSINNDDITGAIKIVEYSASERRRYSEIISDTTDAEKILQWLIKKAKENNDNVFFYSYLQGYLPKALSAKDKLNPALEVLSDGNYIFLDEVTTHRRPKRIVELNPALLS